MTADLGYRRVADGGVVPDQGILSLSATYGDPFEGEIVHPFDSLWAAIDLNTPGKPFVSRIEERGILKGWELTEASDSARHIAGFSQEYECFNNASQVFGAQVIGAGVLSRYPVGPHLQALTEARALVIPLAGIRTTDFANPERGGDEPDPSGGGSTDLVRRVNKSSNRGREGSPLDERPGRQDNPRNRSRKRSRASNARPAFSRRER